LQQIWKLFFLKTSIMINLQVLASYL